MQKHYRQRDSEVTAYGRQWQTKEGIKGKDMQAQFYRLNQCNIVAQITFVGCTMSVSPRGRPDEPGTIQLLTNHPPRAAKHQDQADR